MACSSSITHLSDVGVCDHRHWQSLIVFSSILSQFFILKGNSVMPIFMLSSFVIKSFLHVLITGCLLVRLALILKGYKPRTMSWLRNKNSFPFHLQVLSCVLDPLLQMCTVSASNLGTADMATFMVNSLYMMKTTLALFEFTDRRLEMLQFQVVC